MQQVAANHPAKYYFLSPHLHNPPVNSARCAIPPALVATSRNILKISAALESLCPSLLVNHYDVTSYQTAQSDVKCECARATQDGRKGTQLTAG